MSTGTDVLDAAGEAPSVTIAFLVYNRCAELRTSLQHMLGASDYPRERVDVIVVDNASDDGSADMVRREFPEVRLIVRDVNCGVSGWNDAFAIARGDFVLALDDDCYLPPDGLRRALAAAREHAADLVSFGVTSHEKQGHRFDKRYRTGLLAFWGCAVLMRREVLERLTGYDPRIFVWANELEFMLRFYDAGFRHVHVPDIVAVHMKKIGVGWGEYVRSRGYRLNAENFGYIAGKLLRPRDATEALIALAVSCLRDMIRADLHAAQAVPAMSRGFARGLRHRAPVNARLSRAYRHNFVSFASPWWMSRPPLVWLAALPRAVVRRLLGLPPARVPHRGRQAQFYEARSRYYPTTTAALDFR